MKGKEKKRRRLPCIRSFIGTPSLTILTLVSLRKSIASVNTSFPSRSLVNVLLGRALAYGCRFRIPSYLSYALFRPSLYLPRYESHPSPQSVDTLPPLTFLERMFQALWASVTPPALVRVYPLPFVPERRGRHRVSARVLAETPGDGLRVLFSSSAWSWCPGA